MKSNNLCVIMYDDHGCIGEKTQDRMGYTEIELFTHDNFKSCVDEWFPEGLESHQYLDMRTELQYAEGGIISETAPNPVHQYATVKFEGTIR